MSRDCHVCARCIKHTCRMCPPVHKLLLDLDYLLCCCVGCRIPMPRSDLITALLIVLLFLPIIVVTSHICRFLLVRKKPAQPNKRD